ncbi:hypothetical protein Tco_1282708 [Tanacetum coccineum]
MEAAVKQCSVDKKYFDIQKKELSLDNDRLLDHIICQDVTNIVMHDNFVLVNVLSANHICLVDGNLESERLKQENDHLFELLLSQDIVHIYVNSLAIVTNYAKMEQDYNDEYSENLVLKTELAKKEQMVEFFFDEVELVKHVRVLRPLDSDLDSACKYAKRIKEVLVYVTATCPSLTKPSEKLVEITPLNKNRKVSDVNVRSKSKSAKIIKRKNNWKPTGKIFTDIGYRWKPTGWTFTIVGNTCPLTRFTSTKVEPLKENTSKSVTTPNLENKIYCRKNPKIKSIDFD